MEKFVAEQIAKKNAKKEEEAEKKFYAELYGTGIAATAKVDEDEVDAGGKKICPFFKAGVCDKGRKCKFSHEMDESEKTKTLNIYMDPRDMQNKEAEGEDKDNIKNWDTKKLEEVVNFNAGKYENTNKPTDIVCKHFLEAIEKKIYGWFWVCPNGGYKCIYRHALPQGYVLKRDLNAIKDDDGEKERLEDLIDKEIYNLDRKKLTPVTHDKFLEWKKKRMDRKKKEHEERLKKELMEAGHKTKFSKILSGKSLFVFQPNIFTDDLDAIDEIKREDQEMVEDAGEGEKVLTHKFEDYYQDNFRKNEKGEDVQGDDAKVEIDTDAFAGEGDLDDLPDDL